MARPLRVLFLADRLSARGGADRHLLGILDRFQEEPGTETLLAVGFDDGSLPEQERNRVGSWTRLKGLDRSGLNGRGGRAVLAGLEDLVKEFRPDLIHLQNVMDPRIIARAPALAPSLATIQDHRFFCPGQGKLTLAGEPCSVTLGPVCLDCFRDPGYGGRMLDLTRARLEALQGLSRILVLSGYMNRELVRAGLDPDSVQTLGPFVHGLEEPTQSNGRAYHLLACRLVARKGVRTALEAARMLRTGPRLVVAGEGSLAGEVAEAAREGLVEYETWADRSRMGRLLAGALSLWLPGLWAEPFGIVGLEALALGTPVIATRVGGVEEWLRPGENGLEISPRDPAGLARAADRLAADPDLARRLGERGRELPGAKFRPESMMNGLMNIYSAICY